MQIIIKEFGNPAVHEIPDCISALNNNCTLVAVKEVTRAEDKEILTAFNKHGYIPNKGMKHHAWTGAAKDMGLSLEDVKTDIQTDPRHVLWARRMTLGEFVKTYPQGIYFVSVHRHALVVRDGKVIDHNRSSLGLRRKVWGAKRVLNAPVLVKHSAGMIKVLIRPYNAKRWGTEAHKRYSAMVEYLAAFPKALPKEIFEKTIYTKADFNYDIKKGLISY